MTVVDPSVGDLPTDVTSFVGRRREIAEVKRLLSASRLVTLTGVGGVGKTRLALRVAAGARSAFDAVWFADLSGLSNPDLVPQAVAAAVGLSGGAARRPEVALAEFLSGSGRVLLLVDNCEHLLDACAVLVKELLHAAEELRILATSRQSLGLRGERLMCVPPLTVPQPDEPCTVQTLRQYEAVVLLAERASATGHGFTIGEHNQRAVARLCRRLEGIPLAIELAAVGLRSSSVEELVARLDDRSRQPALAGRAVPPRQRTLQALVDWSFQLLSPAEQTLWARLSVFAGPFDLETVEAVCADENLPPDQMVVLLDGLLDKSLVVREEHGGTVRFRMLETLRRFAERRCPDRQRKWVRHRHRDHYLRLAERAADHWFTDGQTEWSLRLKSDEADLRAALEYCLREPGEAETGLHLATLLHQPYWLAHSLLSEGRHWLDHLLHKVSSPSLVRARALYVNAWLAAVQGDRQAAEPMLEQCRILAERYDDEQSLAYASYISGYLAICESDRPKAIRMLDDALARHTRRNDLFGRVMSAFALASALQRCGQSDRAARLFQTALDLTEEHGEQWCRHWVLTALALERWRQRRPRQADALAREGMLINRMLGDRHNISWNTAILAWTAADLGDHERAALLIGAADQVARTAGIPRLPLGAARERYIERYERHLRQAMGDQAFDRALRTGRAYTLGEVINVAVGEQTTSRATPTRPDSCPLTPREQQIAELVADGLSNKQIAATLVIAQRTVEGHVAHILDKLDFTSRAQIAGWAITRIREASHQASPVPVPPRRRGS